MSSESNCPKCGAAISDANAAKDSVHCASCGTQVRPKLFTAREAYNVAADLGYGVNFRKRDNILQAKIIGVSVLLGAGIGALLVSSERLMGALAGAFVGMILGLFGSGIYLMIYRAARHIKGQHD
jgi:uncharacterized membrane protein YvbJ